MLRILYRILAALLLLYVALLIPGKEDGTIVRPTAKPFAWNRDSIWQELENDFREARIQPAVKLDSSIHLLFSTAGKFYKNITAKTLPATDSNFNLLLSDFFSLAPLVAARPVYCDSLVNFYIKTRNAVKQQSCQWSMHDIAVRNTLYSLLYGMRAAVEEVLLQQDIKSFKPAMFCKDEPSVTPSTSVFGIKVHSGDLLVSRGGAEVSAFIARANDYPANFSHVALVYVDEKTNTPYLIESHIEKGVALATVQQYEADKKLRFMVLRPRADLRELQRDKMLPQRAAVFAYEEAQRRHIPYDFKMNFYDSTAMFCSEVGSYAYRKNGMILWKAVSTISSQGAVNWLNAFGVENFVTQMPGDLEYDPQLSVVAEWRDMETLFKDHIDNAVTDALLEAADKGKQITYNYWMLPFVRVLKGWCMLQNLFGKVGMIPEGMSATQALKNQQYVSMFGKLKKDTETGIQAFVSANGYRPPYWSIVSIAKSNCGK
ncbi:MAG: YiiX/YebB-like N1pC/P60 family cysteine hydrolase [Ferruginibacter sp.]